MLITEIFRPAEQFQRSIALYADTVKAGFPSPALFPYCSFLSMF